jgi:hypothetical protein
MTGNEGISGVVHYYRQDNGVDWASEFVNNVNKSVSLTNFRSNPNMLNTYQFSYNAGTEDEETYVVYNEMGTFSKPYYPYILIKDLKINFESLVGDFFDTEENKEQDILYTNQINDDIVTELDDIELYCNTYNPDYHTSLSYSFVMDA